MGLRLIAVASIAAGLTVPALAQSDAERARMAEGARAMRAASQAADADWDRRPATAGVLPAVAQAPKTKAAWEYLKEPAFKSAYLRALGHKANTPWLAKRAGPAPEDRFVQIAGQRYVLNAFCKAHDCGDNNAVILYSPEKKLVYGTIHERGRTTLIGDPPQAIADELAKLWKAEWRSNG